jgi:hypothetical protein
MSTVVKGILRLVELECCKAVAEDKVLVKRQLKLSRRRQKDSSRMDRRKRNRFCKWNVGRTNSVCVQLWVLVLRRLTAREPYCFDQKVYYTLLCNTLKVCVPDTCLCFEISNPYSPQSVALFTFQYTIPYDSQ